MSLLISNDPRRSEAFLHCYWLTGELFITVLAAQEYYTSNSWHLWLGCLVASGALHMYKFLCHYSWSGRLRMHGLPQAVWLKLNNNLSFPKPGFSKIRWPRQRSFALLFLRFRSIFPVVTRDNDCTWDSRVYVLQSDWWRTFPCATL